MPIQDPKKASGRGAQGRLGLLKPRPGKRGASGPVGGLYPPSRERRRAAPLAAASILLCAVVSALVAVDHLTHSGEIREGVSVGGVALGGKSPEEAREILSRRVPERLQEIRLSGPSGTFALPAEDLGVRLDARATAERAYAVGRRGSLLERLAERVRGRPSA